MSYNPNNKLDVGDKLGDLDGDGRPDSGGERIIWLGAFIAALLSLFWLAFWISSFIHGFDVLAAKDVAGLPAGIGGLFSHPGNPASGWPEATQAKIAPAWLFWPIFLMLVVGLTQLIRRCLRWWRDRKVVDRGAQWATDAELKPIMDQSPSFFKRLAGKKKKSVGMVLGMTEKSKIILRLPKNAHALVVAGTQTGKTAGLCTPTILEYDGAVIATSVKYDLIKDTIRERMKKGRVYVFDPSRVLRPPSDPAERAALEADGEFFLDEEQNAFWSPLDGAKDWGKAMQIANVILDVSFSKGGDGGGSSQFFQSMALKVLPVFLYAAAIMDEDMRRVMRWFNKISDKKTLAEIDAILRWSRNSDAFDVWRGFVGREQKLRGDIGAMVESALVAYGDPKIQESSITKDVGLAQHIDPANFFDGGANTIYVVASPDDQKRLEPIFVALIEGLMAWVLNQPRNLKTPCLVVLDEAANIAALPRLPEFLSTIASKGVTILTVWQDFSQIKARYGDLMNTILGNSKGKMVLKGVSDPETISYFTAITGKGAIDKLSVTRSEHGSENRNLSISQEQSELLDADVIRRQEFGRAILVYDNLPAARVLMNMYFLDNELRVKSGEKPLTTRELHKLRIDIGYPPIPFTERLLSVLPFIGKNKPM